MTVRQNPQLNEDDLELLSAYIDNQLAAAERGMLEARLEREPALRGALDELRGAVALLRDLPALTPPRSFALDPLAFAPRRSPLFGWLRMGATLASVLLALTFAVDFVGRGALRGVGGGAASSAPAPAQMRALTTTEAPAAAATSAPAAEAFAPAPTEAIAAAPPAPASAAGAAAAPTSAPAAAIAAAPTAAAAAGATMRSADTSAGIAPTTLAAKSNQATVQPTPSTAQNQGEPSPAAAAGGALPPVAPPLANPGGESPDTLRLQQPSPAAAQPAPSAPTISPIRLIEVGLASLALLLGLAALWVRRRAP